MGMTWCDVFRERNLYGETRQERWRISYDDGVVSVALEVKHDVGSNIELKRDNVPVPEVPVDVLEEARRLFMSAGSAINNL